MNTRSKTSFLQGHYNFVTVINNNSVIFIRFSHLLIVYISLKALIVLQKLRHQNTDILKYFLRLMLWNDFKLIQIQLRLIKMNKIRAAAVFL